MRSRRALLVAFFLSVVVFTTASRLLFSAEDPDAGAIASAAPQTATDLYRYHFRAARHERMFLASIAFFVTFALTRAITHSIRAGRGPFHDVETSGGGHVHHLVWGILLLLGIGYLWLIQVGTGARASEPGPRH